MTILDTLFFSFYVDKTLLMVVIAIFALLLGLFFNDPYMTPSVKGKVFGIGYVKILSVIFFLLFFAIVSLALYFGFTTVEKDDIKKFIDNGYIESGASAILIDKITKESNSKSNDEKKYERVTYYMLSVSIIEDRKIKEANEFNIDSEDVIDLLESGQ